MALANTVEVWLSVLGHACVFCQKGKQIPLAFYLHRCNYSENSEWYRQQEKYPKKGWGGFLLSRAAHILVP